MIIKYEKLNTENFSLTSLDNFQRYQEVFYCWRKTDGEYKLRPVHYIEDWDLCERRKLAERILKGIIGGCLAYAATLNGEIVGFAFLENKLFGSKKQYIDLAEFYVSKPQRRLGIGKKLFEMACNGAKGLGAKKMYISAHSAEESIAAYKSYGCVMAEEINFVLAEKEPCDLQMEYNLIK